MALLSTPELTIPTKAINQWLATWGWPSPSHLEDISGNINGTCRLFFEEVTPTGQLTAIIKWLPSGGTLRRYPQYTFPADRLGYERQYYELLEGSQQLPCLLAATEEGDALLLEDLATDYDLVETLGYQAPLDLSVYRSVGQTIARLHALSQQGKVFSTWQANPSALANYPFVLTQPFEPLDPAQASKNEAWATLHQDFIQQHRATLLPLAHHCLKELDTQERTEELVLLHGDLHAGSLFLHRHSGEIRLIDAELCTLGPAAYDVGMFIAHAQLIAHSHKAVQAQSINELDNYPQRSASLKAAFNTDPRRVVVTAYCQQADQLGLALPSDFDSQVQYFASFEQIRRVLGVAKAPYALTIEQQRQVVQQAAEALRPLAEQGLAAQRL